MTQMLEKFNSATVALRSVVGFFGIIVALTIFWMRSNDHIKDEKLHANHFTDQWQDRIENLELSLGTMNGRLDRKTKRNEDKILEEVKELIARIENLENNNSEVNKKIFEILLEKVKEPK